MNQKVYVIKPNEPNDKRITEPPAPPSKPSPAPEARTAPRANAPAPTAKDRWARVLRAYLLGPIALVLWPAGRLRVAWAVLGAGTAVAVLLLALSWSSFLAGLQSMPNGLVLWLVTVVMVILTAEGMAANISPSRVTKSDLVNISTGKLYCLKRARH